MTEDELSASIDAEMRRQLLNPDPPRPKTIEEADALYERGAAKLWGLVLDAARLAGREG